MSRACNVFPCARSSSNQKVFGELVRSLSNLTVRIDRKVVTHRMKIFSLRVHGVSHSGTRRVYNDKDIEAEIET